jgi:hypothetical protein
MSQELSDIAEGATKAVIEESYKGLEGIKGIARRLLNKELALIRDPEEIDRINEKKKLPEYKLFRQYITDPDLRLHFQMGLSLKELYKQGDDPAARRKMEKLRSILLDKSDAALHIAEFAMDGLFSKLYSYFLDKAKTEEKINYEMNNFFKNIENFTSFVQAKDTVENKVREIVTKINAHNPNPFVIACIKIYQKADTIKDQVMEQVDTYTWEEYSGELVPVKAFLIIPKE